MHSQILVATTALLAAFTTASPLTPRAAAYHAPKGKGAFNLQVIATAGALKYSGMFLEPYHTGAGLNVLTAFNDQSEVQKYNFTSATGDVSAFLGPYPYTLSLDGEVISPYDTPSIYNFIGFNVGEGTPGQNFSFTTPGNYLQFPKGDDYVFSVCPKDVYSPGVYVPTLVWREKGVPEAESNKTCADVKVKAVF